MGGITTNAGPASMIHATTHRLASCWVINRKETDGAILYYTSHTNEIEFAGRTYETLAAIDASAARGAVGFKDDGVEVKAALSSSGISAEDLARGLYEGAEVIEYVVNWMYPWAGAVQTNRYKLAATRFNGAIWEGRIASKNGQVLRQRSGQLLSRECTARVADDRCKKDISGLSQSVTVVTADAQEPRRLFRINASPNVADDYFQFGRVLWTSGDNDNLVGVVKTYDGTTEDVELMAPMPFDIQAGDALTIEPGCDGLYSTCDVKFGNKPNHQGSPFSPGTDKILNTPLFN